MMISTKKLIKMARKWQRIAAKQRKRISFPKKNSTDKDVDGTSFHSSSSSSTVAEKGHFVVYTADQKRYSIPIAYLNTTIFRELFKMSEEEFGIPSHGPITLPCDSVFMDYLISLVPRKTAKDIEQALLMSIAAACRCSVASSMYQQDTRQQNVVLCSF